MEEGVDVAEAVKEETLSHRAQPGAPNPPIDHACWVHFRNVPLDFCAVCLKKGHMADDCRVPPTGKNGTSY